MTARDDVSVNGRSDDGTMATSQRSTAAVVVVGLLLLAFFGALGRFLVSEPSANSSDEAATPSTTTQIAREPQIPIANQGSVEVRDGVVIESLALGAPLETRIAFGGFQGPVTIVDLSDGSTLELDGLRPILLTDNYFVAQPWDVSDATSDYSLVVVNLRAKSAARVWWNAYVQSASADGDGDRAWIGLETDDGTSYLGFNLATNNGQIFEIEVPGWSWLVPTGNREPYVNVPASGIYEISGEMLEFVGRGVVLAASEAGEVWWRCDESLNCTVTLSLSTSEIALSSDRLTSDGVFALSDDGRYFAFTRPDWAGVSVFDSTTGTTTEFETGRVWNSSALVFVDSQLIIGGELGLEIADLTTGQTHPVEGVRETMYLEMVSG